MHFFINKVKVHWRQGDSVALISCRTSDRGSVWGWVTFMLTSQLVRKMWPQVELCDGADLSHMESADERREFEEWCCWRRLYICSAYQSDCVLFIRDWAPAIDQLWNRAGHRQGKRPPLKLWFYSSMLLGTQLSCGTEQVHRQSEKSNCICNVY